MEVFLYKLNIYGNSECPGRKIWEIFFPVIRAIINEDGDVQRCQRPRNLATEIFEIEVPSETIVAIDQFIKQDTELMKIRKQLFAEINEKFKDKT
jgi:hypothetical protein